jgi:hypothetical protein
MQKLSSFVKITGCLRLSSSMLIVLKYGANFTLQDLASLSLSEGPDPAFA